MLGLLGKFFDSNEKEVKKLLPIVTSVNALEESVSKLNDSDFPKKTQELKDRVQSGESLELLLPEVFALVREAARRTIAQRHFDVQLMAATVLASGKIAEQKTGEGKTLSAVPALYLHSLTGKNVHLVTVNDYLARRDAGWMGPIFHLLGVSVSSIISDESFIFDPTFTSNDAGDFRLTHLRPITRKEAYQQHVVYGINSEFGFDYLRDNMVQDSSQVVQRGHYFAIVDEVDSVLIDEARTPHIISAPDEKPSQRYYEYAQLVEKLTKDTDYKVDEKLHTAHLTDHAIAKIEKLFGIKDIYEKDFDTVYHLEAALKAKTLFHKEKDYIVKDNQVILVDEFTGRLLMGRRLSEGLHQAIEAKESVMIQRENKTMATVSLQNYFRMYERLAGMTGTAVTEAEEFHKIYKLDVVVIPTHRPMIRVDHQDAIYKTGRAKISAVASEIEKAYRKGQPVLVGTTSIEKNEIISQLLRRRGIPHQILNAKNHEKEAEIIASAGEKGAVTVATNMAGRGVDIILGGDSPKFDDGREKRGTPEWEGWEKKHVEVVRLGGLFVIGTERHESRRIDNQLRGRSGRQGDPGASRFFVALDDDIMRLFGGDTIAGLMTRFNMPEDVPLEHPLISRAIEQAQVKVEGFNFDIRKHLVQYDDVLNKQREIIYTLRRKILFADIADIKEGDFSLKQEILGRVQKSILTIAMRSSAPYQEGISLSESIIPEFTTMIPFDEQSQSHLAKQLSQLPANEQKSDFLFRIAKDIYEKREEMLGNEIMRDAERFVMLSSIDMLWMDHLDAIENLRSGIGLRGYGQKDPLVEYKNEAFTMFEQLMRAIDDEVAHRIYRIQVLQSDVARGSAGGSAGPAARSSQGAPSSLADATSDVADAANVDARLGNAALASPASSLTPRTDKKKLGRNDPCWCSSGRKYKKCHWPDLPAA